MYTDSGMKVIILAAGFSTRLRPLTDNFPKGLLQIQGEEIILHLLKKVQQVTTFFDYTIVTNDQCYPHFVEFFKKTDLFDHYQVINNGVKSAQERLGAIGDLVLALETTGMDEDIMVLPSDTLVSLQLSDLLHFYETHQGFVNVVYDAGDTEIIRNKLGCAQVVSDRLIGFEEKPAQPVSTLQSVPIYIYPQEVLSLVKEYASDPKNNLDSPGAIIPYLIGKVPTFAYQLTQGYYYDVGTKEVYDALNRGVIKYT